jgi:hypothetical protein
VVRLDACPNCVYPNDGQSMWIAATKDKLVDKLFQFGITYFEFPKKRIKQKAEEDCNGI